MENIHYLEGVEVEVEEKEVEVQKEKEEEEEVEWKWEALWVSHSRLRNQCNYEKYFTLCPSKLLWTQK